MSLASGLFLDRTHDWQLSAFRDALPYLCLNDQLS
jgi:hypothetical protein